MKERWFNYRPICLVFAFLLLGSVFSFFVVKEIVFTLIITILILSLFILLAVYKKSLKYILIPLIAFTVGVGLYYNSIYNFEKAIDYTPKTIEARIYNVSNEKNRMIAVECDDCKFNKTKQNSNIILYIYDNEGLFKDIHVGSVIKFSPLKFYKTDLFYHYLPNTKAYSNNLKYTATVEIDNITYIKTDKNFDEIVKDKVKDNLYLGLTNENAELAYSALFGDKDLLPEKQYDVFKLSGVAHLLAVSGLHVGIIVGILNYIFKKCKIKKWYKFAIIAIFLLLYMHICGYSVSIIRASIMSLILLLANILGKEYDSFTSISIAGIIIFLINPLCVFDVAFLLSFSCVIGITMLYRPIKKTLTKTKLPNKLVDSVSISLATTISIVFIMAFYFKTLNIISIIANVILIPIFTFGFVVVFVCAMLSLILPYVAYLLYPVNYIFEFLSLLATIFANLSISNFNTLEFNYIAIVLYFILLLFVGRFCTAKYQYKIFVTLPMVALLFYCLV